MNKKSIFLCLFLMTCSLFCQEALKSVEEEYYDFIALKGAAERPSLGYRTLSDSVWNIDEESIDEPDNIWKKLNLGSKFTIFQPALKNENWFLNGINQNIKLKIYGPELFNSYNTAVPYGYNDGGLWQGKGYNTSLTAGVRLEGYGVELTFKPQISFSQNLPFEYMGVTVSL